MANDLDDSYDDTYTSKQIPAPQFVKFEQPAPTGYNPPTPFPLPSHCRPRPRPVSLPVPVLGEQGVSAEPISTGKGKGVATMSFIGHGLMNLACFNNAKVEDDDDSEPITSAQVPKWDILDDNLGLDDMEGFEEAHHRAASAHASSARSPSVRSSARSSSPPNPLDIIIRGGSPVKDKEELQIFLSQSHHAKLWMLVEKGLIITGVFGPHVPDDQWRKALQPLNVRCPGKIWEMIEKDVFCGAHKASAIGQQFNKILSMYKDIKYIVEERGFEFDHMLSENAALRVIHIAIREAREAGDLATAIITAWEFYHWMSQGWFGMIDSKIGDHPNFWIGTHRSGRVSPSRLVAPTPPLAKGKEKRAWEDDNPLSPRPRASVRPRPSTLMHASSEPVILDVSSPSPSPRKTRSQARNVLARVTTVPHQVKPEPKPDGLAGVLADTYASAQELKEQLLQMWQTQLDLDMKSLNNRYQIVNDEQKKLEEERLHRIRMDEECAEREAIDLEERVNQNRTGQFFDLCLRTISNSKNVPEDIVEMANNHVHMVLKQGVPPLNPFAVPRSPATISRRAASVPVDVCPSAVVVAAPSAVVVAAPATGPSVSPNPHTVSPLPSYACTAPGSSNQLLPLKISGSTATVAPSPSSEFASPQVASSVSQASPSAVPALIPLPNPFDVPAASTPTLGCSAVSSGSGSGSGSPSLGTGTMPTPYYGVLAMGNAKHLPLANHPQLALPALSYTTATSPPIPPSSRFDPPLRNHFGTHHPENQPGLGVLAHSAHSTPLAHSTPSAHLVNSAHSARSACSVHPAHPTHSALARSVHSGYSGYSGHNSHINHLHLHTAGPMDHGDNISPTTEEFVHIGNDTWNQDMDMGANA